MALRRIFRRRIYKIVVILIIFTMVMLVVTVLQAGDLDILLERDRGQFGPFGDQQRRHVLCGGSSRKQRVPGTRGMDFWNFTSVKFLENFKNPCFLQNATKSFTKNSTGSARTRMRCLPFFILAGFPKSGTTDLWYRLLNHPDVVARHVKEPMFFNKGRAKHKTFTVAADEYIDFYANTTLQLQRIISPAQCHGPFPYHHGITGEGSVDTAYDVADWQALPGNKNCVEPVVTNADYVHRLNPNTKIIFVVRNPTERLYSDYIYESRFLRYEPSAKDFHSSVQVAVRLFTDCAKENSVRHCAYSRSQAEKILQIRLQIGLYHIFIEDWLRVFGPNNVLIVASDNTRGPRKVDTFRQILKFLQIRPLTEPEEALIYQRGPINTRSLPEKDLGDMLNETRRILDDFYRPYNEKLFKLDIV